MPLMAQFVLTGATTLAGAWLLFSPVIGRAVRQRQGRLLGHVPKGAPMFRALSAIALIISAVGGWLFTRGEESERPTWRDDSLDEWRQEREAEHEKAREARSRTVDQNDREQG